MAEPLRKDEEERNQYYEPANDSGDNVRNIRNVKVEKKKLTSQQVNRLTAPQITEYTKSSHASNLNTSYNKNTYPDTSEVFKQQTEDRTTAALLRDQEGADKKKQKAEEEQQRRAELIEQEAEEEAVEEQQRRAINKARKATKKAKRKLRKKKKQNKSSLAEKAVDKTEVAAINSLYGLIYGPVYTLAILPLATLGLIFFATTAGVYYLKSLGLEQGLLTKAVAAAANIVDWGLKTITGSNIEEMGTILMLIFMAAVLAINIFFISALIITYMMAGIKPLSGKLAWVKWIIFILVIISSILPGLSMLPVVAIWMFFVFILPK
ncbi:hypothetical protein KC723_00130 [Candidatus Kaiserbacteria bacterium]|nr:hypothetical protein [Candidatus Kaiserbacteria bacterium]